MASAVANAIHDAIGVRLTRLPFTPVDILQGLQELRAKQGAGPSTEGRP
jgi:hypothetical protein